MQNILLRECSIVNEFEKKRVLIEWMSNGLNSVPFSREFKTMVLSTVLL